MPQLSVFMRLIALSCFAFAAASPAEDLISVEFKMIHDYMIVVPVTINGAGPFHFLLDTGTSRSVANGKIADQLSLPRISEGEAVGVDGNLHVTLVHSESVSMGSATVRNLNLTVLPGNSGLPSDVLGILGEDFLANFDVLIDNRHHRIELQPGPGTLGMGLAGERLPIRLHGIMDGQPTIGRLIVACRAPELSSKEITLQLDSGINSLLLFGGRRSLGSGAADLDYTIASASKTSSLTVSTRTVGTLQVGSKVVANVVAIAPPARPGTDTDGLLPTSLFSSIFISHSQRFVIFDPWTKH